MRKIYHIVHIDRISSILKSGGLFADSVMTMRGQPGSCIGLSEIKERRLNELTVKVYSGLFVGDCVPFYFCPRSVMLYLIHRGTHPQLKYRGGQEPIVHLVADLEEAVKWAEWASHRWLFTLSNAGSYDFEARNRLRDLDQINWQAVEARNWKDDPGSKQAEFLMECFFPWHLIERIGVMTPVVKQQVSKLIEGANHIPLITQERLWYY